MEIYLKLFGLGLIIVAVSILCYLLKRKTKFGNLKKLHEQIIIGVIFGGLAIMGTEFGVSVEDATANVRDAAPLCAGLLFGAPAGIVAGVIGGVERFVATYWGRGAYTQWACSISTILAGLYAGFLRKYMLDNKRARGFFGMIAAATMEILHLTLIFVTNIRRPQIGLGLVEIITVPMVFGNAISVFLACFIINMLSYKINPDRKKEKTISREIQKWLFAIINFMFIVTIFFLYEVQTNNTKYNTTELLDLNLSDVSADMTYALEDNMELDNDEKIASVLITRSIGESGHFLAYNKNDEKIFGTFDFDIKAIKEKYDEYEYFEYKVIEDGEENKLCIAYCYKDDYLILGYLPYKEAYAVRDATMYLSSFMQIIAYSVLFIAIYFLIKKMVLTNMLKIKGSLNEISTGNLDFTVNVETNKEFSELSKDINTTVDTLKGYIDKEKEQIAKELALAKSIQTSALPQVEDNIKNIKEFDINAKMFTAKEVGGDFYDFYTLPNDRLAFIVADVSGKGIPAAMFMMRSKTVIKSLAEAGYEVDEIITKANKKLCEHNDAEMFVTAWFGILDLNSGVLEYVNAGHNPPLLFKGEEYTYLRSRPGLVLAGYSESRYKKNEIKLDSGDKLFLYTDGVTEATNLTNELFGEDRLISYLNSNKDAKVTSLLESLKGEIDLFSGERDQFDDITMLAIDYYGANNLKKKTFEAIDAELDNVIAFVDEELEEASASMKIINQVNLSIEEIFINIAHYAYNGEKGVVDTELGVNNDVMTLKFIDSGKEFNPLAKADPDVTLSADERQIGGLGIFLVKKTMDSVSYDYIDNKNILTITKKVK